MQSNLVRMSLVRDVFPLDFLPSYIIKRGELGAVAPKNEVTKFGYPGSARRGMQ